jgi:type IV pilus assembly protein PilO
MATAKAKNNIDLNQLGEDFVRQFRGLNPNDPGAWPILPKILACLALVAAILAAGWFFWLTDYRDKIIAAEAQEVVLKDAYRAKYAQAVNIEELRKQRELVSQYVRQLEKQLPTKADMDQLLSDINQAGLGRGLQFELFKPGQVVLKEYYAELPIAVKVSGGYHEMAAFTSDLANLSRIVTLNNVLVGQAKEGVLSFETTAKTFRYLDPEEIAAQRQAEAAKAKPGQPK